MFKDSTAAVRVTVARLEATLSDSHAFTRIEPRFYVVRQGTAYVYIQVIPWEPGRALLRLVAQLAGDVDMTPDLAMKLLRLNARLRFGAFGYVVQGSCVVFAHTLLGGETLDAEEILTALRDLSVLADEFDDRIVEEAGGKRMQDLIDAPPRLRPFFSELDSPGNWDRGRRQRHDVNEVDNPRVSASDAKARGHGIARSTGAHGGALARGARHPHDAASAARIFRRSPARASVSITSFARSRRSPSFSWQLFVIFGTAGAIALILAAMRSRLLWWGRAERSSVLGGLRRAARHLGRRRADPQRHTSRDRRRGVAAWRSSAAWMRALHPWRARSR